MMAATRRVRLSMLDIAGIRMYVESLDARHVGTEAEEGKPLLRLALRCNASADVIEALICKGAVLQQAGWDVIDHVIERFVNPGHAVEKLMDSIVDASNNDPIIYRKVVMTRFASTDTRLRALNILYTSGHTVDVSELGHAELWCMPVEIVCELVRLGVNVNGPSSIVFSGMLYGHNRSLTNIRTLLRAGLDPNGGSRPALLTFLQTNSHATNIACALLAYGACPLGAPLHNVSRSMYTVLCAFGAPLDNDEYRSKAAMCARECLAAMDTGDLEANNECEAAHAVREACLYVHELRNLRSQLTVKQSYLSEMIVVNIRALNSARGRDEEKMRFILSAAFRSFGAAATARTQVVNTVSRMESVIRAVRDRLTRASREF